MKSLFLVFIVSFVLAFTGCTTGSKKIGCQIEQTVVTGVTPAIASALQCSNPAAIQSDLTSMVSGLNLCRETASNGKLSLPAPICGMVADMVVGGAAKLGIPTTWGCTAANAQTLLKGVIVTACSGI